MCWSNHFFVVRTRTYSAIYSHFLTSCLLPHSTPIISNVVFELRFKEFKIKQLTADLLAYPRQFICVQNYNNYNTAEWGHQPIRQNRLCIERLFNLDFFTSGGICANIENNTAEWRNWRLLMKSTFFPIL